MNRNAFRWIIAAVFLFLLVLLLSSPYIARTEDAKFPPTELGALRIYPFGMIFAALLVLFFAGAAYGMKKHSLNRETASWFAMLAVPCCFVLSRLGFCLFSVDKIIGTRDYGMFFRAGEGGFLLWGALAGLLLAAKLAGKTTNQSGAKIADSVIVPACLLILALRLLCGLLFKGFGAGLPLDYWFDPEETEFAYRYSVWPLEDYSFFERFPFATLNYYDYWCWAVFVLQALWAGITGFLVSRSEAAPGGKTVRFVILFSCGTIVLESMLYGGEIVHLPWLAFVKANQILSAIALLTVLIVCLCRLPKKNRKKAALIAFPQFLAAIGMIIVMEFAAFEKKLTMINWLPSDGCHLIMGLACLWIALAFRKVWKQAYAAERVA